MASPPSVNNGNYDPKTDKARKASSNDPGWKYGYRANLEKRDQVTCTLRDIMVCGGTKRLKQHLAGGYGDVKMCPRTTTAIRKEMRDYLEGNRRRRPLFIEKDDEQQEEEEWWLSKQAQLNLFKWSQVHLHPKHPRCSQVQGLQPNKGVQPIYSRLQQQERPRQSQRGTNQLLRCFKKNLKKWLMKGVKGVLNPQLQLRQNPKRRSIMWICSGRCGSMSAAYRLMEQQDNFRLQFGSGYVPPPPYLLGEPLLKDAIQLTSATREEYEQEWKQYCCTLMSDGWSDRRGRHLRALLRCSRLSYTSSV